MSLVETQVEWLENEADDLRKTMMRWRISAFIVCAAIIVSGCSRHPGAMEKDPLSAKIGKDCVVQFRRGDGLGAASDNPVPPLTANLNGADTQIEGKLELVSDGWVVVRRGDTECWIPRESILLIQFRQ